MDISPARPGELATAFGLLFAHRPEYRDALVDRSFALVAAGELDPGNVLVARRDGLVVGAVFCQPLPGSSAMAWPPQATDGDPAVEDALAQSACRHAGPVRLIQAFLDPGDEVLARPLLRNGFQHLTRVWRMERPGDLPPLPIAEGDAVQFTPLPASDPTDFQRTLLECHRDTLDCPELDAVRTPEDLLAGYRDCCPDLSHWWLARRNGLGVGVLLMAGENVAFLGIIPAFRRQNIGRKLVAHATQVSTQLGLIVDSRNEPAIQLYRQSGFTIRGAQDVYVRIRTGAADTLSLQLI